MPDTPLVLVHGLTNQHRDFWGIATELAGRQRLVAPDLIGRGNSTTAPAGCYGIDRHAADVLAAMDALGIEQAVVGGHSMGAYIATAVAVAAPHRVSGLVFIDGGVLPPLPPWLNADAALVAVVGPVMERLGITYPSVGHYLRHWQESGHFGGAWGPSIEAALIYDLEPVPGGYRPRCSPIAAKEDWRDLLRNRRTRRRLKELRCPVLALAAEHGLAPDAPRILGPVPQWLLARRVSEVTIVEVPDTTHHSITLAAHGSKMVTDAITEFARRL